MLHYFFNSGKYFIMTWPTKSIKKCSHGFTKLATACTGPAGSGPGPLNMLWLLAQRFCAIANSGSRLISDTFYSS